MSDSTAKNKSYDPGSLWHSVTWVFVAILTEDNKNEFRWESDSLICCASKKEQVTQKENTKSFDCWHWID